jgi:ParB family chromosome partitioning protein
MADQAQELLAGSGWVPEPLRTPGQPVPTTIDAPATEGGMSTNTDEAEPEPAADSWPAAAE